MSQGLLQRKPTRDVDAQRDRDDALDVAFQPSSPAKAPVAPHVPSPENSRLDWALCALIFAIAAALRLYKLDHPDGVVCVTLGRPESPADEPSFDEVHFGKFASYYLRREFFFDVHPPLFVASPSSLLLTVHQCQAPPRVRRLGHWLRRSFRV